MDFLMESGLMHWMSERMSFTNWVKADFHELSRITLKFSAPLRLRVRYRLGAGSSRYGNCFFLSTAPPVSSAPLRQTGASTTRPTRHKDLALFVHTPGETPIESIERSDPEWWRVSSRDGLLSAARRLW